MGIEANRALAGHFPSCKAPFLALASTKPLQESDCFSFVGRDESSLVGIEAIRARSGHFPPRKAGLGLDRSAVEVSPGDARSRARAWQVRTLACSLKLQIHIESWPRQLHGGGPVLRLRLASDAF